MLCLSEKSIDLLTISCLENTDKYPDFMNHVRECLYCKDRFNAAMELYLEIYPKFDLQPSPLYIAKPVFIPNTVLCPHKTLLAADSVRDDFHRYQTWCVLANESQNIMIRVIKDKISSTTSIFILADNEDYYKYVMISIPGIEGNWLTDSKGVVIIQQDIFLDPNNFTIEIRTPISRFTLNRIEWTNNPGGFKEIIFQPGNQKSRLSFSFSSNCGHNNIELYFHNNTWCKGNIFDSLKLFVSKNDKQGTFIKLNEKKATIKQVENIDSIAFNIFY